MTAKLTLEQVIQEGFKTHKDIKNVSIAKSSFKSPTTNPYIVMYINVFSKSKEYNLGGKTENQIKASIQEAGGTILSFEWLNKGRNPKTKEFFCEYKVELNLNETE
jgi:hypothetical protein